MIRQAIRLALVLAITGAVAACGMFDDEEPLEGERVPVRELMNRQHVPSAGVTAPDSYGTDPYAADPYATGADAQQPPAQQ